jgi:hypothetical protein
MALVHHPVLNKRGEVIASAVTNLDLHDLARAATTYGVRSLHIVTPLVDQQDLVARIIAHWTNGAGAAYNAKRRRAVEQIRVQPSLRAAINDVSAIDGGGPVPLTVASTAHAVDGAIGFSDLRRKLQEGTAHLLLLGTAWGLAESVLTTADYVLEPIRGCSDYNHLSVRCAAAVILDRLLGIS